MPPAAREIGSLYDPWLHQLQVAPELWVMGESPMGLAALATEAERDLFEMVLVAIANGSFPKPGGRSTVWALANVGAEDHRVA